MLQEYVQDSFYAWLDNLSVLGCRKIHFIIQIIFESKYVNQGYRGQCVLKKYGEDNFYAEFYIHSYYRWKISTIQRRFIL